MNEIKLQLKYKIHYVGIYETFHYKSDFIYKSEYHDQWILYAVTGGCAEFSFSGRTLPVGKQQVFLLPPHLPYSYRSVSGEDLSMFCLGFTGDCEGVNLICLQTLSLTESSLFCLSGLKRECQDCFSPRMEKDGAVTLTRSFLQSFGGEQLIKNYLEILLITLIRSYAAKDADRVAVRSWKEQDFLLFQKITAYYKAHLTSYLNLEEICTAFRIGQNHLQRIFRSHTGMGAIEYFCHMRIDAAQRLMREESTSPAETARRMGYHSARYFSKQFKQITGSSPTAYLSCIKAAKNDPLKENRL